MNILIKYVLTHPDFDLAWVKNEYGSCISLYFGIRLNQYEAHSLSVTPQIIIPLPNILILILV